MRTYALINRAEQTRSGRIYRTTLTLLLSMTAAVGFAARGGEAESYLRDALAAQADQVRAGEQRARREYVDRELRLFHETGNLTYLLESAQTFGAQEAVEGLSLLLASTNSDVRLVALDGLARHAGESQPVLPQILNRLEDPDGRVVLRATEAIAGIGPAASNAVPSLVQVLTSTSSSPAVREQAAGALGSIGPAAAGALTPLDQAVRDPDAGVALSALLAAGRIRGEPPLTCAELRAGGAALFAGHTAYRALEAARAPVCPAAESAVLLVRVLSNSPARPMRLEACRILGSLAVGSPEVVGTLLELLADPERRLASAAETALAGLPATNVALVPLLTEAAAGSDPASAEPAARMLARFGPSAGPAAETMLWTVRSFRGAAYYGRTLACLAVVRHAGTNAVSVRGELVALLPENSVIYSGLESHQAKLVRAALFLAIAAVGAEDEALPAVVDELANALPSPLLAAAARTAGALPEHPKQLVPLLGDLLARPGLDIALDLDELNDPFGHFTFSPRPNSTCVYLESIRALRQFGPAARPALTLLRRRAQDPARHSLFFPAYQHEAAELADALAKLP
jgi:hypothetical protein